MIDLNCDMGESYGDRRIGHDAIIMPWITSANIACGFHGGDPETIQQTVAWALEHGVQIGAHPAGVRDIEGFGRQPLKISPTELVRNVQYQIDTLQNIVDRQSGRVTYVKAHGALYHLCQQSQQHAQAFVRAVKSMDDSLRILAAKHAVIQDACDAESIGLIAEAFADRNYQADGALVPRSQANAVIEDPADVADQVQRFATGDSLLAADSATIVVACRSICFHGDQPNVVENIRRSRQRLESIGCEIVAF